MSGDESFLSRWSRRKREASRQVPDPGKSQRHEEGETARSAAQEDRPTLDPDRLPPIESIGAAPDLAEFLKPGVPLELTRAALRQAWSADPTIRDFIGLSENSWDFTAPDGVPGFGSLDADQVRRLLAQVAGEPLAREPSPLLSDHAPVMHDETDRAGENGPEAPACADSQEQRLLGRKNDDAAHQKSEVNAGRPSPRPRRHGGALPE